MKDNCRAVRTFQPEKTVLKGTFPVQKSYQSRLFQKSGIVFVQNRQFCQLPFLPAKTIILAIDSNGAVGHLLTRSAVFVKM